MTKGMFSASALSLFLGCFGPSSLAQQAPATGKAAGEIAAAAKSFLAALDDGQRTLTPSHTGAQPATYELEAKTVRPLGRETDKALALVGSLDEAQRKQAVLGFQMHEPVLGKSRDGQTIQPEGIKVSALTEKQREMLLDLAGEWT